MGGEISSFFAIEYLGAAINPAVLKGRAAVGKVRACGGNIPWAFLGGLVGSRTFL